MKIKNKWLVIIIVVASISAVIYPVLMKYYFRPHKYKEEFFQKMRNNSSLIKNTDDEILGCVNCIYENMLNQYGHVDYFPEDSMSYQDVKSMFECYSVFLFKDKQKVFIQNNIDSLTIAFIEKQNAKNNPQ